MMTPASGNPVRIAVWAHPGSSKEDVTWDPWRKRWVICVTAPAIGGRANAAILQILARRLRVGPSSLGWARAGTSRAKVVEVTGLSEAEVRARLSAGPVGNPPGKPQGPSGSR